MNKKLFFSLVLLLGTLAAPLHAMAPAAEPAETLEQWSDRKKAEHEAANAQRALTAGGAASMSDDEFDALAAAVTSLANKAAPAYDSDEEDLLLTPPSTPATPISTPLARSRSNSLSATPTADEQAVPTKQSVKLFTLRNGGIVAGVVTAGALYKAYIAPKLAKRAKAMQEGRLKTLFMRLTCAQQAESQTAAKVCDFTRNKRRLFAARVAAMEEGRIKSLLSTLPLEPQEPQGEIVVCIE